MRYFESGDKIFAKLGKNHLSIKQISRNDLGLDILVTTRTL